MGDTCDGSHEGPICHHEFIVLRESCLQCQREERGQPEPQIDRIVRSGEHVFEPFPRMVWSVRILPTFILASILAKVLAGNFSPDEETTGMFCERGYIPLARPSEAPGPSAFEPFGY